MSAEPIHSATPVSLTVMQLGVAVAFLLGGGWAIIQLTTSGVRDDLTAIRQSLLALQTSDKDGARRIGDTDLKLSLEISGLKSAISGLDSRIQVFSNKLDGYDKSVTSLTGQMAEFQKEMFQRNNGTTGNPGRQ